MQPPRAIAPSARSRGAVRRRTSPLLSIACSALLLGGSPVAWATGASTLATLPVAMPMPLAGDVIYARSTTLDEAGRVLAPVMVNGQGPFRFILDTGANRSAMSAATAEALGVVSHPDNQISVHGITGSASLPVAFKGIGASRPRADVD